MSPSSGPHTAEVVDQRRQLHADARRRGATASDAVLALVAWTMLIMNVSATWLTLQERLVVPCTRWQANCTSKSRKVTARMDELRSEKPHLILCKVYAKLPAMLIQH